MPLRIGCVQYLNARPLIHGFPGEVVFDHPSVLCRQLADGILDVALVSSFEFIRNPIYVLVEGVCVSSHGPVYSVFIAHGGKLSEIETIEIDPASQTAVNLLRCLLAQAQLKPQLVERLDSSGSGSTVTRRQAQLFIGDQAIRFREQNPGLRFWDLGEVWQRTTKLPFVYALWLIRPEVCHPKQIAESLRLCRDNNLRDLDSLVIGETEFSREFCRSYLRENISYYLGAAEMKGLEMFRELCETHSILARRPSARE